MCCPSSVRNASMRIKYFGEIWLRLLNELLQLGDFAHFFVSKDFIFLVSVDRDASRIVTTVFKAG